MLIFICFVCVLLFFFLTYFLKFKIQEDRIESVCTFLDINVMHAGDTYNMFEQQYMKCKQQSIWDIIPFLNSDIYMIISGVSWPVSDFDGQSWTLYLKVKQHSNLIETRVFFFTEISLLADHKALMT